MADTSAYLQQTSELALQFRQGFITEAVQQLAVLVEPLIAYFAGSKPQHATTLQQILMAILQCQQHRDWLGLADYLQYELQDLLRV